MIEPYKGIYSYTMKSRTLVEGPQQVLHLVPARAPKQPVCYQEPSDTHFHVNRSMWLVPFDLKVFWGPPVNVTTNLSFDM